MSNEVETLTRNVRLATKANVVPRSRKEVIALTGNQRTIVARYVLRRSSLPDHHTMWSDETSNMPYSYFDDGDRATALTLRLSGNGMSRAGALNSRRGLLHQSGLRMCERRSHGERSIPDLPAVAVNCLFGFRASA